jgi:hypothetical protein
MVGKKQDRLEESEGQSSGMIFEQKAQHEIAISK